MIAFWVGGALLAALALALVLRPLVAARKREQLSRREANIAIYKDQLRELEADRAAGNLTQPDYERARLELEARLLEDVRAPETAPRGAGRKAAMVVALAVPILAIGVYFATGNLRALDPHEAAPDAAQLESMVARLAAKLRENPDDADGWKLLGRSYTVMGRFPEAVDAYARAAQRAPRDAQLLADFADALAMTRGQRLQGEPEALVKRALAIEPDNLKALALAGSAAYERQDFAGAAALWGRMLPLVPPDSEDARAIGENVAEAKKLAGIAGEGAKPGQKTREQASAHPGVRGTVKLAPRLAQDVKPDDVVFVFARAAEGPPMPLAVMKARARDLPMKFALNDAMAMAPGMSVSAFSHVVVTARVAKSGSPKPAPGDLEGTQGPVANDASGVAVTIDTVVR
jgi:cytochrome c-type biogenesis protein CcmH